MAASSRSQSRSSSAAQGSRARKTTRQSKTPAEPTTSPARSEAEPVTAPKTNPTAETGAEGTISLSEPLSVGTQIIVTARGLEPSHVAIAEIEAPEGPTTQRLKTDPTGLVQVFLHGPRAGDHKVSVKAGASHAAISFEVK